MAPLEERIYRHDAWKPGPSWCPGSASPLNALIKQVEPTAKAKFVAFQSLYDPKQMPPGRDAGIPLPYVEGLRMDEAMHPLAMLCVGMYGEVLPNQDGAPRPPGGAVEIRLQEHQVHREDQVRREAAADHLEISQRPRVRILFERESGGRSSALEPGDRTPAWASSSSARRSCSMAMASRWPALRGHGSAEELLSACH